MTIYVAGIDNPFFADLNPGDVVVFGDDDIRSVTYDGSFHFPPVVKKSVDDIARQLAERFDLTPDQKLVWQMIYRDEGLGAAIDWYKNGVKYGHFRYT